MAPAAGLLRRAAALCLLVAAAISSVQAQAADALFKRLLGNGYDPSIRPMFNSSQPVTVDVQFRVNLLYAVDSKNEQYSLDFFVRELWTDERLVFDPALWPESLGSLRVPQATRVVWKPDTFFLNAVSCTTSDNLLTLKPSGRLNWSRHQTCVFRADFKLEKFPFDSQTFDIRRTSYAYPQRELVLQPMSDGPCFLPDPTVGFENSLWDLNGADCAGSSFLFRVGQEDYTQVTSNLYVKRKSENYIVKLITPMFIIVTLSTLTFWIDPGSPPARVGGTVTLVLSIVTFNLVVSQDLPKINYSTLLDWYVWKCFLFVVFAVGEFAVVNNILTSKVLPARVGFLIDDFCCYTLTITWWLSNLLFWPLLSTGGELVVGAIEIAYFSGNVIRIWWNWKHEKKGMADALKALYVWLKHKYEYSRRVPVITGPPPPRAAAAAAATAAVPAAGAK